MNRLEAIVAILEREGLSYVAAWRAAREITAVPEQRPPTKQVTTAEVIAAQPRLSIVGE